MSHPYPLTRLAAGLTLAFACAVRVSAEAKAPVAPTLANAVNATSAALPEIQHAQVTVPAFAPLFADEADAGLGAEAEVTDQVGFLGRQRRGPVEVTVPVQQVSLHEAAFPSPGAPIRRVSRS